MGTKAELPVNEPDWPCEEFNDYLETHMAKRGIASRHQLSQDSGVPAQSLSNWKNGTAQPTFELLNKLAPVLDVPRVELWIRAGRITRDELIIDGLPEEVPAELHQLIDLYMRCPAKMRDQMRTDFGRTFDAWGDRIELYHLRNPADTED